MASRSTAIYLQEILPGKLGLPLHPLEISGIAGGSINKTFKITIDNKDCFFLKNNSLSRFPGLFQKEKNGLSFLATQNKIRIPEVIDQSDTGDQQFLLLEWIEQGNKTAQFWKSFGRQLAGLHTVTHPQFGFNEDNYMGALPQANTFSDDWVGFFIHSRLSPQVQLAVDKKWIGKNHTAAFEKLYQKLTTILSVERPSLLHGDLWSGNFLCDKQEQPVLIDPAVYFGHRYVDIAMTTIFGGFDADFYSAYNYYLPFAPDYKDQLDIYNLYPLLVHLNLFGSSYLADIELILKKFTG